VTRHPGSAAQDRSRNPARRQYAKLRIAFPILFFGWFPFGYVLGSVFRFFRWNMTVCVVIVLALLPLISIVGWQWSYWQCPRCGYAFKGKYPFYPSRCSHCNLPKWAESPDA
jgi:hypothetical protein